MNENDGKQDQAYFHLMLIWIIQEIFPSKMGLFVQGIYWGEMPVMDRGKRTGIGSEIMQYRSDNLLKEIGEA